MAWIVGIAALLWILYEMSGSAAASSDTEALGYGGGGTAGTVSGRMTNAQLQALWIANGGNPAYAAQAAAIAMAESGGNPDAINYSDPHGGSFGLWQINAVHGSLATTDPNANAAAAVAISNNGLNWYPWSTYGSGKYLDYLGDPGSS